MIPQFLQPAKNVDVPAPPGFQPAEEVEWARRDQNIYSFPSKGNSFAQKVGIRYEAQVQSFLSTVFEENYFNNPWFSFRDLSGTRRCRPDGLLLGASDEGHAIAIVFEIKVRHMPDAWWQLRRLYAPVVAAAYPRTEVRLVEIVREFDPSMPFPERPLMLEKIDEVWQAEMKELGVFLWKL